MRIGIDARFLGVVGKGLGRYTQKLIENLEEIDKENYYFVFLGRENFDQYAPHNPHFQKVLAPYGWYTLLEQLRLPQLLYKYRLDLMHFPHFNVPFLYRRKFVVTIHDLILLKFPTLRGTTLHPFFYKIKFLAYKLIIASAIRRAQKIITVSNFTKEEILKYYAGKAQKEKTVVTYEAGMPVNEKVKKETQKNLEILRKYVILKPYLLYVGNAYPHKNLERMIQAFTKAVLPQDLRLVLIGKADYFYTKLKQFVVENNIQNVIFAGQVEEKDLSAIYQEALACIFPSLYEGFGIPPLEAMANQTPVISSNHPCMREILDESVYFFDAQKEDEMMVAMQKITQNPALREALIKKGNVQAQKYSWREMAQKTLAIYHERKKEN
jgi:glycosyltransferase involved in cell wall biosynthesis